MKYVISRFNQDIEWVKNYTSDYVIYDRSDVPVEGAIVVPNIGSDIYDKFTWIIDNYDNLPDVVCLTKANLFKYISKEEFEEVKDNKVFTPLLTKNHEEKPGVSYYKDGIYWEVNNGWYLEYHHVKTGDRVSLLMQLLGIQGMRYVPFAPGSNYILTKENIKKHPKELYEKLRAFLEWDVYPGEAMIIERGLYILWNIQKYQ
jgi:hypothetical protein